jgi:hypothetical protein
MTLPTDPVTGSEGDIFVNTTEKALKVHNGITWVSLAKSDDPTPFYMHTHTYDGDVHTIDVGNQIDFKNISGNGVQETLPVIIGLDGGEPSSEVIDPHTSNLTLLDGGTIGN